MSKRCIHFCLILGLISLTHCGRKTKSSLEQKDPGASTQSELVSDSAQSYLESLSDSGDDSTESSTISDSPSAAGFAKMGSELELAKGCSGFAFQQPCTNGVRTIVYDNCRIGLRRATLSGSVTLTYSDTQDCRLAEGESVTRTLDLRYTSIFGEVYHSSISQEDYRGTEIGGGSTIKKITDGIEINVPGLHHVRKNTTGREQLNISLRTLEPKIVITGSRPENRLIVSGAMEVNHNLAGFTATHRPDQIKFEYPCCYPVSGSMQIELSGSIIGKATIKFLSCGKYEISYGEVTREGELNYCQYK